MKPLLHYAVRTQKVNQDTYLIKGGEAWRLNETSEQIITLCDGETTLADIATQIAQTFGVAESTSLKDCEEFLNDMASQGLIEFA